MVSEPRQTPTEDRVAIDVSALQVGAVDERAFVAQLPAALRTAGGFDVTAWSSQPGTDRSLPDGARHAGHRWRAAVASSAAVVGMAASAAWVAGDDTLIHLASGPRPLRLGRPGVITIHRARPLAAGARRSGREGRAREELRRSADQGAVIHAVTRSVADEVVEQLGVDRSRVVVALPGIGPCVGVHDDQAGIAQVTVLATGRQDLDAEVAIRLGGTNEVVASVGDGVDEHSRCLVIAAPLEGFSAAAVSAMGSGVPIVAVRSPAAVELLTGAATFVEPSELDELVDIALALAGADDARAINVAAGRARATDFAWGLRVTAVIAMYRRALADAR
jgi:hypothetical protein